MEDSTAFGTFGPSSWKPLAAAFEAFYRGDKEAVLTVYTDDGEPEIMPVSIFFRAPGTVSGSRPGRPHPRPGEGPGCWGGSGFRISGLAGGWSPRDGGGGDSRGCRHHEEERG